jgi:multidrug efflux pump subunit AcrA (membrane-fusion protein)
VKITILVLSFCLSLMGCGKPAVKTESASKDLPSFKEGKGLSLPAETRRCIGLEMVEVTERKLVPEITTAIQVYQAKEDVLLVIGFVNADQASQLKTGQTATLTAKQTKSLTGKLVRLDEQTKSATGQVEVLLEISGPGRDYPIGTFLTATFTGGKEATMVVIPRSALLRASEGDYVFVVNGEHLLRTPVKVGAERDEVVEITDGLYSGDKVASRAVQNLWLTELRFVKGGAGCCAK